MNILHKIRNKFLYCFCIYSYTGTCKESYNETYEKLFTDVFSLVKFSDYVRGKLKKVLQFYSIQFGWKWIRLNPSLEWPDWKSRIDSDQKLCSIVFRLQVSKWFLANLHQGNWKSFFGLARNSSDWNPIQNSHQDYKQRRNL